MKKHYWGTGEEVGMEASGSDFWSIFIQSHNDDKNDTSAQFLTFHLAQNAKIIIGPHRIDSKIP